MHKSLSLSFRSAILLMMIILGTLVEIYLPWYVMGIVFGIFTFLLAVNPLESLILGFSAGFLIWAVAGFWINFQHPSGLPVRMAHVFPLGGNVVALYIVTGLLGGITGGFWAWAGSRIRQK